MNEIVITSLFGVCFSLISLVCCAKFYIGGVANVESMSILNVAQDLLEIFLLN